MNNIKQYVDFVDNVTAMPSKDFDSYVESLRKLDAAGCNIARLDTALTGLGSESGEGLEILKKLKFQGKEWNAATKFHILREAGDIMFYWIELCLALGVTPDDIINENIKKLSARYPNGFEVSKSENRKPGDI